MENFLLFLLKELKTFCPYTGITYITFGHIAMIFAGLIFIYLAISKEFEPTLLIPIGFGILIGSIPFKTNELQLGIYEKGSIFNTLYQGIAQGLYPPLIFLGIGAMTDFSSLISNPKLTLIGASSQFGIFSSYILALIVGFKSNQAASISLIGGANAPAAIYLSSKLSPDLIGAIAISAYFYTTLGQIIQPPIMRLLTTKNEKLVKMKSPRVISHTEKILFPIFGVLLTCLFIPSSLPLLGMLFLGNLLKESGITRRLAETARGPLLDTITILLGVTVGAFTQAPQFLSWNSIKIFILGFLSFVFSTISGILFVKFFNLFLKKENKINPLIGNAGISVVPHFARISQFVGLKYNSTNYLLTHATGSNVAGLISTSLITGILLEFLR